MIDEAERRIRRVLRSAHPGISLMNIFASKVDLIDLLHPLLYSRDFLNQQSAYFLKQAESSLTSLSSKIFLLKIKNLLVILWRNCSVLPQSWKKLIQKHPNLLTLNCQNIAPYELNRFTRDQAEGEKINLDSQSISLITEYMGNNLQGIHNIITTLALVFPETKTRPLTTLMISPYIGGIRKSVVFKLTDYLTQHRYDQACYFVIELLSQNEHPLAILGILARFFRQALLFGESSQNNSLKITHLPIKIKNNIIKYKKFIGVNNLKNFLKSCQQSDQQLKISNLSPQLVLIHLITSVESVYLKKHNFYHLSQSNS